MLGDQAYKENFAQGGNSFKSCLQNKHPRQNALDELLRDNVEDDVRKAERVLLNKGLGLWDSVPQTLVHSLLSSSDAAAFRVSPPFERDCSWSPPLCARYDWPCVKVLD